MIEPLEDFTFKGEASAFLFAGVGHLLEGKEVTFDTLVSHKVDGTESALAEQALNDVTVSNMRSCGQG